MAIGLALGIDPAIPVTVRDQRITSYKLAASIFAPQASSNGWSFANVVNVGNIVNVANVVIVARV